jgi:type I restriction enzyme S subunit
MADDKRTLAPQIRFKGYTHAWEQRTIGGYGNFYYGKSAPKWSVTEDATTPCIRYGELYTKFNEKIERVYSHTNIPTDQLKFSTGKEVLVPRVGEKPLDFANCSWLSLPDVAIGEMISVYNTEQNPLFVAYYFNALLRKAFAEKVEGGNVSNLYYDRLVDIPVSFPAIQEQEAISKFFNNLTIAITLRKRKLEGLKKLKAGYLQQMFPQVGETVPMVRFSGFSGDWEVRKLGEMLIERNEQIEESEEYPLMSFVGNVGVVPKGEQYDRSFLVKDSGKKYKKTELNDFIYSSNNLETGSIGFNNTGNAVISPVYSIFFSNSDSESQFVGLLSKSKDFINKMIHYRQGVMYGQWRIHEKDFLKIKILSPSIAEQNRIIQFFHLLDQQIAAQAQKLTQMQNLKKAYLQKMFV